MPKISSPTEPASSRSTLATPPDFNSWTRCNGSRTACSKARLRIESCSRLVALVPYQRPQTCITTLSRFITVTTTTMNSNSGKRAVRHMQPRGDRGRQRLFAQDVVDDEFRRRRRAQTEHGRNGQGRQREVNGRPLVTQQAEEALDQQRRRADAGPAAETGDQLRLEVFLLAQPLAILGEALPTRLSPSRHTALQREHSTRQVSSMNRPRDRTGRLTPAARRTAFIHGPGGHPIIFHRQACRLCRRSTLSVSVR